MNDAIFIFLMVTGFVAAYWFDPYRRDEVKRRASYIAKINKLTEIGMDEKNKVLILFLLDEGLSQEEGEVEIQWKPLNFMIYSEVFIGLIYEAADDWLGNNTLVEGKYYAVTFKHRRELDGAGACTAEYFEPVDVDISNAYEGDF